MKRLTLLFSACAIMGQARAQTYSPCSTLPPNFWCYSVALFDTLDVMTDTSLIVLDTTGQNRLWQRGLADKPPFNLPAPVNGIVTDSLLTYPTSQSAHFLIKIPMDMGSLPATLLFFEHRFETDTLTEGGKIEFSCDQGANWTPIGFNALHDQGGSMNFSGIDDQTLWDQNNYTFSGSNGSWTWSGIQWVWYTPVMRPDDNRGGGIPCWNMDSLYVRFTFESDDVETGKAGWMIRNIVVGSNDIGSGLERVDQNLMSLRPNPTNGILKVDLPNGEAIQQIIVQQVTGRTMAVFGRNQIPDISHLDSGLYLIRVETDRTVFSGKVIKQ